LVDKIKGKNIKLWVIFNGGAPTKAQIVDSIKTIAAYTQMAGVEFVIYPHDNTIIPTMDSSVTIIKSSGLKNVYTSFHLCHELRAGNALKLLEVGRRNAPYIKLATIAGADYLAPYTHTPDWKDAIKPLNQGNFDTQEFVQVLAQIGFTGPTFLHTFGIKEPSPQERLSKSLTKWNEMSKTVATIMANDITKTLDAPESAYFDKGSQAWYISNLGGGFVTIEKDSYGWISKLDTNGKIIKSRWVQGLDAPTGIASYGNKLYVADRGVLVEIDIPSAKIIRKIPLVGSQFVNDVAAAPNGDIYVSDTFTDTIYRLPHNGKIEVFYASHKLEYPNGLWIDGDYLIIATWGPMTNRATFETSRKGTLKRLNIKTKKLENIGAGVPIANMDAVVKYGNYYYASDWVGGKLLRIDAAGKQKVMLSGFSQFADFGIDSERGILMMPEMSTNRVFTIQLYK
jgi:DNA-binding beta-propeller fold protein YncE